MKLRFLIIFSILVLSLSACVSLAEDVTPPPDENHPVAVETEAPTDAEAEEATSNPAEDVDGEAIYLTHCAECHNADGSGANNIGADLTNADRLGDFPDKMLGALILKGNGAEMPPINANLNDYELGALIAYVRELSIEKLDAEPTDDGNDQAENTPESEVVSTGSIMGTVINGSGGDLPEGFTIQLEAYDHDMMSGGFSIVFTLETTMNADGSYLFEEIEMPEGRAFVATIIEGNAVHSSQPNFATKGNTELDLPITYYESNTDASQLSIDRLHIFFEPPDTEAEIAHIVEVFVISNPTLYVVTAEEGQAVMEFVLPEGAMNIEFDDGVFGERYTETATGFGDTSPILPGMGRQEIVVFFDMPYKKSFLAGNQLDFVQKIEYPVDSAIVMAPQGLKIESDLLTESGERESQGLIFKTFSSQPLPIGATFKMSVSGKVSMEATGVETNPQENIIYGALALGVVLIGVGVWFYFRDRDEDDTDYEEDADASAEIDDVDELMDAIIALDDAYRSGDLSKEVYQKRRAALKKQLKELV